jgi:energy-coupling factor transporter ATP-binding protein EcfA2
MADNSRISIKSVTFSQYKAFASFTVRLAHLNILVGPNNCGKSTVVGAFRILAEALKRARAQSAVGLQSPKGRRAGWQLPEAALPVSTENVHTDYDDTDTTIEFAISNGGKLILYFPGESAGSCFFFAEMDGYFLQKPGEIRRHFALDIQPVPVLGPVEHREQYVIAETVRKNLSTTRASRNFRNYWLHFPEGFDKFAELVARTWAGMEVKKPEWNQDFVAMYVSEKRRDRELFWAGFGFQIWLQLLTHISRASNASVLIVDEPEIYLHPDVQRQLLGILRDVGADVVLATHSTEIMAEADPTEILLVDKTHRSAKRLVDEDDVQRVLTDVGSVQNVTLTRLARNRRVLFVEGDTDTKLLRRFARRLGFPQLAAGTDLTAVASGGFSSWDEIRALASGFERALGVRLNVGAIFDRDYWCDEELTQIRAQLADHLQFAHVHTRKELENYLLEPVPLQRALEKAVAARARRAGKEIPTGLDSVTDLLEEITHPYRDSVQSQVIAKRVNFFKSARADTATITAKAIAGFNAQWADLSTRLTVVPGKNVLAELRERVAKKYAVTLTDHAIISEMRPEEVAGDLKTLLDVLESYRQSARSN